jgi:hypothetical protein
MSAMATRPAAPAAFAHPLNQRWTLTLGAGVELQAVFVANLQQWRLVASDGVVTVREYRDASHSLGGALSATEALWNERFACGHGRRRRTRKPPRSDGGGNRCSPVNAYSRVLPAP